AAGGGVTRPRLHSDDALFAVRQGSRGRSGPTARLPLVCSAADRLPHGPVRAGPPYCALGCCLRRSVGSALPRLGSGKASHSWISMLLCYTLGAATLTAHW